MGKTEKKRRKGQTKTEKKRLKRANKAEVQFPENRDELIRKAVSRDETCVAAGKAESPSERAANAAEKNAKVRVWQLIVAAIAAIAVIGGVLWQVYF